MFLAKCIFVDLNSEFIEYDFDELDLDPTSPHKLDQARIVNLEEDIWASDESGWLHHVVSKPSPAVNQWCGYWNVPQGHDKLTGYEVGYNGPRPYTSSPYLSTKNKKAVTFLPDLPTPKKKKKKAVVKGSKRKGKGKNYLCRRQRNPNNLSDMPMLLPFSFIPIFINLNTNVCLFTHNNGKHSTHGSSYTHVCETPFTTNPHLFTLLHHLNWSFTHKHHRWT